MSGKKSVAFIAAAIVLAGCSPKESLKGTRENLILSEPDEDGIALDGDNSPLTIDPSEENSEFVQPHFNVSHCYPPLKFAFSPTELWSKQLDFEATKSIKTTAAPIVAEGKAFCIDAAGIVYALDKNTGKELWKISLTVAQKDGQIGGAIAYDKGRLIVTSSFAEGFCLNATNGKILWRIKLPAACKGDGITIHDGKAFIMCGNSSLQVINIDDGKVVWSHSGMITDAAFIGSSCPAIDNGVVYLAYPSGEIFALLEETGAVVWDGMLSKFSLTNAARAFSHPRACPVIKDGIVYFVAANEQTAAFDAKTGKLIWKSDHGGVQTPLVSGNCIFVLNSQSELICLNKNTGKKRWSVKISNDKDEIFNWCGALLIKDYVAAITPAGYMTFVSVYDGKIKKIIEMDYNEDGVSVNPVIANGIMYVLMNCGKIVAYK
ncbi:MAG: PQQ-binding-like beta-propeller repeat protein [Holosporaceae bacterium]|jgi:outer membrane protein assembly factor BamB|nr:PQQ-binding-like beta-propeller repeat protein [Holosporaceae bacterium]